MATSDDITTDDAAKIIGVSSIRVRQLCEEGKLQAKKWGRSWMVNRASAERFERRPAGRPVEVQEVVKPGRKAKRKPPKS